MIPVGNDNARTGSGLFTALLITVCVGVFAYEVFLPEEQAADLVRRLGLVPADFWRVAISHPGRWPEQGLLPLVASSFLHGSVIHLLGNIWSLWIFGRELEGRLGVIRFLLLYLLSGMLAGLLHAAINPASTLPTIGASGAIAGVMGAYFMLYPFNWITFLVPVFIIPLVIKLPAAIYLLVWMASQLAGGYQTLANGAPAAGGIAFWAHVGGFVAGIWLVRRWNIRRRPRYRR